MRVQEVLQEVVVLAADPGARSEAFPPAGFSLHVQLATLIFWTTSSMSALSCSFSPSDTWGGDGKSWHGSMMKESQWDKEITSFSPFTGEPTTLIGRRFGMINDLWVDYLIVLWYVLNNPACTYQSWMEAQDKERSLWGSQIKR